MKQYLIAGWLMLCCLSCGTTTPDAGSGPMLSIDHLAGEMPDHWEYLAYPAHHGMIGEDHVLLLSKAPKPGSSRSILPIAMLSTSENGKVVNWIIANDAHADYQIKDLATIDDLMTNHNGIKSTLERWIINRNGIGQIMMKGWKSAPDMADSNNQ